MEQQGVAGRGVGASIRFGVQVGQYHLLIAPQTFSEVVAHTVVYPMPHTPRWFLGLLNQRGNLVPVFDLHQLWHMAVPGQGLRTVLVLDQGSEAVGMGIDGMPQSVRLVQRLALVPPPANRPGHPCQRGLSSRYNHMVRLCPSGIFYLAGDADYYGIINHWTGRWGSRSAPPP